MDVGLRLSSVMAIAFLAGTLACGNKLQTREAVERGIRRSVQQRGLNLDAMEVRVQNVSFHDNKANATVGFFPKGGQLSEGMMMHYVLEQRDNEWVIVERSQSDMHQHSGGAQMPAGHPQVSGTEP